MLLIVLWFAAWVSTPQSQAITGPDLDGYGLVKVLLRCLILALVAYRVHGWLIRHAHPFRAFRNVMLVPLLYLAWNTVLIPFSSNMFYSSVRWLELALIWMTAWVYVCAGRSAAPVEARLLGMFRVFTILCCALVVLYVVLPEWAAKPAGIDPVSREMRTRLGGSILRVDLAAAFGGSVLLFWLFARPETGSGGARMLGVLAGGAVLVLTRSRTGLALAMVQLVVAWARAGGNRLTKVVVAALFLGFATQWSAMWEFLLRGERIEDLADLNGRLSMIAGLWDANNWFSLLFGNGYLVSSPDGLDFYVPGMVMTRNQPHNGYLSVWAGSGLLGLLIVGWMFRVYLANLGRVMRARAMPTCDLALLHVFVFLGLITLMDYGIWGVTSPGMLIFAVAYVALAVAAGSGTAPHDGGGA